MGTNFLIGFDTEYFESALRVVRGNLRQFGDKCGKDAPREMAFKTAVNGAPQQFHTAGEKGLRLTLLRTKIRFSPHDLQAVHCAIGIGEGNLIKSSRVPPSSMHGPSLACIAGREQWRQKLRCGKVQRSV